MANELTIEQISTVLGDIVKQATGQSAIAVTDTSSFVSVANTALHAGYDPLTGAFSQVISRSIFRSRPYERKFGNLEVSNSKYGNHIRKINAVDMDFEDDDRMKLVDGQSIDQYRVKKPVVQQTNFYGENTYQKSMTIYRDQLDTAFSGPDQFSQFLSLVMSNAADQIEQAHETTARATLGNLMGGCIDLAGSNVIHCLAEYNAANGTNLTAATVLSAENISGFAKWLVARIQTVADMLTERSTLFHQTLNNQPISRHTPVASQRLYMFADYLNKVDANTLSMAFHDEYLKRAGVEKVNFWQSISTPMNINVTPGYTAADGTTVTKGAAVSKPILATLFDEEAAGYTVVNEWSAATPFNARGGYYNQFWHFTDRYWNDFTENNVVFVLD